MMAAPESKPTAAFLTVVIPGPPCAQERSGQSRSGKRYDPPNSRAWKRTAALLMRQAMGRAGPLFAKGPLELVVVAVRACPLADHRKKSITPRRWDPSHTGDADNIAHAVMNAATMAQVWTDDCQVARLVTERWTAAQGEAPCVVVEVRALDGLSEPSRREREG